MIGFLSGGSPASFAHLVAAFLEGLAEAGFVDGQNVAIEYRWAEVTTLAFRRWPLNWSAKT